MTQHQRYVTQVNEADELAKPATSAAHFHNNKVCWTDVDEMETVEQSMIDDFWNVDGNTILSEDWIGFLDLKLDRNVHRMVSSACMEG